MSEAAPVLVLGDTSVLPWLAASRVGLRMSHSFSTRAMVEPAGGLGIWRRGPHSENTCSWRSLNII
eukprot:m.252574 g.252574  ORF g.252574 m.252574 type:complete len:66 (-) comp108283_c0_seq1:362-559(-)